jgi:hypothetical protein
VKSERLTVGDCAGASVYANEPVESASDTDMDRSFPIVAAQTGQAGAAAALGKVTSEISGREVMSAILTNLSTGGNGQLGSEQHAN